MDFNNQVVWITGASSGIGEAFAKAFNVAGAKVILSARNIKELQRVQGELPNKTAPSVILPFDVQKYQEAENMAKKAIETFGKLDILINNAGLSQRSLAKDTPFIEELKIIEVDLIATIALTKAVLPQLMQHKGQVVIISSVMGKINTKYRSAYAAAKHGAVGYFESLRLELAEDGVNVCNIMPGFIATNITKNAVGSNEEIAKNSQNNSGLSPEDFVKQAIVAIYQRKGNVYIGGFKERAAMLLKRLSPSLFDRFIVKQKVT